MLDVELIKKLARLNGWIPSLSNRKLGTRKFTFTKLDKEAKPMTLEIFVDEHKVVTELDHPLWGLNRLFRGRVTDKLLAKIFFNPRQHTKVGYRIKALECTKCHSKRCYCPVGEPHFFCDHDLYAHTKKLSYKKSLSRESKTQRAYRKALENKAKNLFGRPI